MTKVTLEIDEQTAGTLKAISDAEGRDISETAARLLKRAARASRPRPTYDRDVVRAAVAEFAEEELALAESALEHRAAILEAEDKA